MDSLGNKSSSDADINFLCRSDTTPPNFVSFRNKRGREPEYSELDTFKTEIRDMISTLFSTQIKELQKSNQEDIKNSMTNLFATQVSELKKLNATQIEIQQTNRNIENSVSHLSSQCDDLKKKIDLLEEKIKDDKKYIILLEDKIEDLQRERNKTIFEIKNVPIQKKETKEDLLSMITCLASNIGCKLEKSDIKDIHRIIGKKEKAQNTAIIVETSSTILRTEMLKMCKIFNTKNKTKLCAKHLGFHTTVDTPIYVSEKLTAKGARLHFLARDLVKSKSYKFCWTSYGKIYIRKDENSPIIIIHSEAQIQQLVQK